MSSLEKHLIAKDKKIKDAMIKLDQVPDSLTLFIVDNEMILHGSLTDGDIRRGMIKGLSVDDSVEKVMNKNCKYIKKNNIDINQIKTYKELGIKIVPIVDNKGSIISLINLQRIKNLLPVDALILAGGRGERLRPLTDSTPKPMLPIGNKPILEHVISHLKEYGIENYHISVRYLSEQIVSYFKDGKDHSINISYYHEDKPLGTIGSASLIKYFDNNTVLVLNADLLTNINIEEMYRQFIAENADMSIATIPYQIEIPYAIIETNENKVSSLKEKPTYTYFANAGIYLIKKDLLKYVPHNQKYDITDLIEFLINKKYNIIQFPLLGFWMDIGKMEDYIRAKEYFKYLQK